MGEPFQQILGLLPSSPQVWSLSWIRATLTPVTLATRRRTCGLLVLGHLGEGAAVDRDHPGGAVGDQRAALVVDDQAALRLHDDLADRLRGGLRGVLLAGGDLEVPEPHEQGGEQREDQRLDDDEPQPAAGVGVRAHARRRSGSSRSSRASTSGTTQGAEQDVGHERERAPSRAGLVRRRRGRAGPGRSARRPRWRRASTRRRWPAGPATAATAPSRDRTASAARRPGRRRSPATSSASAQRPAMWSAGGTRSSSSPPAKPRTMAGSEPYRRPTATTTSRTTSGTTPSKNPGNHRCGRTETCRTSGRQQQPDRRRGPGGGDPWGHRSVPSGSRTARSLSVPDGTTTPTRSRAPKSTYGSTTARCVVSRTLE